MTQEPTRLICLKSLYLRCCIEEVRKLLLYSNFILTALILVVILSSCHKNEKSETKTVETIDTISEIPAEPTEIIDSEMSFEEAIAGSGAPQHVIDQLILLDVRYFSTDRKIHKGQILVNQKIADAVVEIFDFMFETEFPVYQVVPIVKFDWDDTLSMEANNSSGFCYRNVMNSRRKSKHATGMAIDINPLFNPIRWKSPNQHRANIPEGAIFDKTVEGTLYPEHPVVKEMKRLGFRWGHSFSRYYDDHHFEK